MGKDIHDRKSQLHFLRLRLKQIDQLVSIMEPDKAGKQDINRIVNELEKTLEKARKFRNDWE